MARALVAELVGMSTALETIAARHLGAEVMGLALVTNLAAGLQGRPLDHGEVVAEGAGAGERLGRLLRHVVDEL
jgi:purine-nucleoside phosphorylase